jgi:hypothetical protein
MELVIRGLRGPGRRCTTDQPHGNVHVGLQRGKDAVDLRPGDVDATEWRVEVDVVAKDDGLDFKGPFVQGRKGDRFVYLTWGEVDDAGRFQMFRRAKLNLSRVEPSLVARAAEPDGGLVAEVELTGADGGPICATPGEDRLRWSTP